MNYVELLKETAEKNQSIVCMGLDPVLERIPLTDGNAEEKIVNFYNNIFDACVAEDALPGVVKPNYAFYAQYGFKGLRALKQVIERAKQEKLPVILDAKRGDIGKTSAAYALEAFEFWQADCLTIAPFMGRDSVMPFIKWCEEKGKGVYILNRTSNPGAKELQNLTVGDQPLYAKVSQLIVDWGKEGKGNVGAVVGATSPEELREISKFYALADLPVPLLIPGVGAQGGSAADVMKILKETGANPFIERINSSSGINYAFEKAGTDDFAGAAAKAVKQLNEEIKL
jgi:orotidine-5'-phosphate decarboxylase